MRSTPNSERNVMFNKICEWFARRFVPADNQTELADALFNWKYGK